MVLPPGPQGGTEQAGDRQGHMDTSTHCGTAQGCWAGHPTVPPNHTTFGRMKLIPTPGVHVIHTDRSCKGKCKKYFAQASFIKHTNDCS